MIFNFNKTFNIYAKIKNWGFLLKKDFQKSVKFKRCVKVDISQAQLFCLEFCFSFRAALFRLLKIQDMKKVKF
jgi:hypothetical protein